MTHIESLPNIQTQVSLAPYTTFQIGGPATYFVIAKTVNDVRAAVQAANADGVKWVVLGGGSDVLVADAGFNGLVIKCELREVSVNEQDATLTAGAGVLMAAAIMQSMKHGLSGLEYATGVPASIGGAIWANLGARGSDIAKTLVSVDVLTAAGELRTLSNAECRFAYRDSIFKQEQFVILSATFQLTPVDKKEAQATLKALADMRKETQDVGAQCAGCVFKNPDEQSAEPAAKMIDDLGLKGKQIGGAKVSDIHANFIINTGDATADDVIQLISYVKQQVRDKKGVQLHEEIEYIGFE